MALELTKDFGMRFQLFLLTTTAQPSGMGRVSEKDTEPNHNTMTNDIFNERNAYENRMMKPSFSKNKSYKMKPYRTCRE